ncbi:MAG: bacillithiol biosynthesis deacetylase BshB1 [Cyclobacteriaceae bacterium]|nr:bacillithiol biosynthesis deacetylase BshB1 [Cyclobacteriaceae bacterium]
MKLDILAFGAHPDDVELSCGGTLIVHAQKGYKTGVVDLTRGEMGTRGTSDQRMEEAADAGRIMQLSVRENLYMEDSWFVNDAEHQKAVVRMIRKYQPEIVLANAPYDRHPDHGKGARLVEDAFFKAGLKMLETFDEAGRPQEPWRPKKLYHYIQSVSIQPDFLVDISAGMAKKMEAIRAYKTQFFNPSASGPDTYISSPAFIKMIESRAQEFGHRIQVDYAEGFVQSQFLGVSDLFHLV